MMEATSSSSRSIALEIDLNEAPLPSPREHQRCGSCGEVEGSMVVCGDCGRRFHVECLGVREQGKAWKCFECLNDGRSGRRVSRGGGGGGGGSGLFDMNASPPQEVDGGEEGVFVNSELVLAAGFPKIQDLRRNPFLGFLTSSMAHPDMRFTGSGYPPQSSMTRFAHINLETVTQKGNMVYLQALKDYISEKRGVLGDGWRVKFEFSESNCKTSALYFAPDGTRFDSMSEVAHYLGLISFETEDKNSGIILLQKGSHSTKRTKDKKANNLKEPKNMLRNAGNTIEVDSMASGSNLLQDGFPVQFEDFFVTSVGKIDPRVSFYNTGQIWPVGYRSIWHDRYSGSIFMFDVLDGGESGPIFRVHRYPCSKHSIPYASKVLCPTNVDSKADQTFLGDDDVTNIHMMFTENSPPSHLDDDKITLTSCFTAEPNINLEKPQHDSCKLDVIGEFLVEERSLSSAWQKAVETLLKACHEAYKTKRSLNFCCNHRVNEEYLGASYNFDTLGKFCYLSGPINQIPDKILAVDELEASCEVLRKWLELDRFGLEAEFVQELIEQLPGIAACSNYKSLNVRSQSSTSQTVRSGFFMAISKDGLQHDAVSNSLTSTHERPNPPGRTVNSNLPPHLMGDVLQTYEICLRFYEVLGLEAPVSRQVLEQELSNPWVEDIKPETRSTNDFQKNVIINTCAPAMPDGYASIAGDHFIIDLAEDDEEDGYRAKVASKCTGVELAKFHMTLLKVIVEEVLAKVKEIFDPFGSLESKSRRGRKKDVEVEKINLDMFPVNEFTWPEVARRLILVALCLDGNLESSEVMTRECDEVFQCLFGDGGTLCGSLTGVAAMEADAMVLAEASKKIFPSVNSKVGDFIIDQKDIDTGDSIKETNIINVDIPDWAQALEPARKLPTNVGARIRRCINEALERNPPEWAKTMLEHSISKEVYKGNASGPTKRAVVAVLEKVKAEHPHQEQKPVEKKEKEKTGGKTLFDAVMKRCRVVLRTVANADEERIFFNLLSRPVLKPNDPDDSGVLGYPTMVSRPLDFRTIDLRLAAGFYVSHESFVEDVHEVWHNLRIAFRDSHKFIDLIDELAEKFEKLYKEEVLDLISKFMDSGKSFDSSSEEGKKELSSLALETSEGPLPAAPWEEDVCKVCGMDKNDDYVLLCDKCDSEYHTYCLDPPLPRIPDGNWYCPSCMSCQLILPILQDERCGTRALSRLRRKRKFQKEFTRHLLEKLARLADTMELMEYWELGIEERVFLFKFLCDEALSSGVVRNHLGSESDSADLDKQLRKLYKELKIQTKKEEFFSSNLAKEVVDTPIQNEEDEEVSHVGRDQESVSVVKKSVTSIQEKISTLETRIAKPVVRREYIGRDLVGRFYWIFYSPNRVVVLGPPSRRKAYASASSSFLSRLKECEMTEMYPSEGSLWTCYESDAEIQELIGWLRDDDTREKDLKEAIKHWLSNRVNDDKTPQPAQGNHETSSGYVTKARAVLDTKFGSYVKNPGHMGKMVDIRNWYRCDCLELVASTRHHCPSCHVTFLTNEELQSHNGGKCEKPQEVERPSKRKKVLPVVKQQPLIAACYAETDSPFSFEEIRAKFCTQNSLREEVKEIGLIGSNGIPSFVNGGSTDIQPYKKQNTNEIPFKADRSKPKGTSNKSSLKNRTPVRICQSSLKPLKGRILEIFVCLKINLFDIETALPKEAFRSSRGGLDHLRAWRAFVKSAQSIYDMVQATIMLEDMIKTEHLKKEWWYWSSPSTAAKISTVSSLALLVYALDDAVYYDGPPPPPPVDPTEPLVAPEEFMAIEESLKKSMELVNQKSMEEAPKKLTPKKRKLNISTIVGASNDAEPSEPTKKLTPKKKQKSYTLIMAETSNDADSFDGPGSKDKPKKKKFKVSNDL